MKIVVAPDKFKGTISAKKVADAVCAGLAKVLPDALIEAVPMADGGEGTVETLIEATDGTLVKNTVTGPNEQPVEAVWGISEVRGVKTAIIEMSAASGLELAPLVKRPLEATTFGTGELIEAALAAGCARLIVGLGGSATTDGGAGAAEALGVRLLDKSGKSLGRGGGSLTGLVKIDAGGIEKRLRDAEILIASDVENSLHGPDGAAQVYGPQKGAGEAEIAVLEKGLMRWASVLESEFGVDVAGTPGAGAAGGLGAGLMAFAGAKTRSGAELVSELVGLENRIKGAALVITGEGRVDEQTCHGKVPAGVARLARAHGVPTVMIAGSVGAGSEAVHGCGIDAIEPICIGPMDYQEAAARAAELIEMAAERIARLMVVGRLAVQDQPGDLRPTEAH